MNMHQQGGVASGLVRPSAGIDVSKPHLDVCLGTTQKRVPNDANGWIELTAMLQAANPSIEPLISNVGRLALSVHL